MVEGCDEQLRWVEWVVRGDGADGGSAGGVGVDGWSGRVECGARTPLRRLAMGGGGGVSGTEHGVPAPILAIRVVRSEQEWGQLVVRVEGGVGTCGERWGGRYVRQAGVAHVVSSSYRSTVEKGPTPPRRCRALPSAAPRGRRASSRSRRRAREAVHAVVRGAALAGCSPPASVARVDASDPGAGTGAPLPR